MSELKENAVTAGNSGGGGLVAEPGEGTFSRGEGGLVAELSSSDFTTDFYQIQLYARCSELQTQATRLMESDPARYANHWAIWTSLQFKKCGWPWPEDGSDG